MITESLARVFLECTFVASFWSEVPKWLKKYQSWRQVLLSNEEILLGFKGGKYTLLNLIILSAKHYIYIVVNVNIEDHYMITFILT